MSKVTIIPLHDEGAELRFEQVPEISQDCYTWYFYRRDSKLRALDTFEREFVNCAIVATTKTIGTTDQFTQREKSIIEFAVWRFMNDAYAQANFYAQGRPDVTASKTSELVQKFSTDARDAGELVNKLRNL